MKQQQQQRAAIPSQTHELLANSTQYAQEQMRMGDFAGCIRTCKPLLDSLPRRSEMRLEALSLLGLAYGMLKQYQQSYAIFSEAIVLDPTKAEFWHNHGLACHYMSRPAEAVRDFERAVELTKNKTSAIARTFAAQLEDGRQQLQLAIQSHGMGTTLEQYVEREKRFTQAMDLVRQEKWSEAELLFRELTETQSRIPSYWGNLGICLIMQQRYDEAKEALKQALIIDPDYSIARDNLQLLPELQRSKRSIGLKLMNLAQDEDVKQSLALYERNEEGEVVASTVIEQTGHATTSTQQRQVGKQSPQYDFALNPYRDMRFTTCPRCMIKTRARKFSLVIHVQPTHVLILDKICRFCDACGLLIVHQDQLEKQLATQLTMIDPQAIGNDYEVVGTFEKAEWNQKKQGPLSYEQVIEYRHDFKVVVVFRRVPMDESLSD
jgi:tetratricopeptide (TPR) repeat protein